MLRTIRRVWVAAGATAFVVFATWSVLAFRATADARAALTGDETVSVTAGDGFWVFSPRDPAAVGLVFFPGGLVDPVAYAPIARAAATAGYPSVLVALPRRGAFGGADGTAMFDRTDVATRSVAQTRRWVVAGHSRGGLVASRVAERSSQSLAGLVLIGTSHPRDIDLAKLTVPVTRIFGTRDTVADVEELEATRGNLPAHTALVSIDGGNHSQFGYYGFQPGDWPATIPRDVQQRLTVQAILGTLAEAAKRVGP